MFLKNLSISIIVMAGFFMPKSSYAQERKSTTFLEYVYGWNNTDYYCGQNPKNGGMGMFTLDHTTITKWGGVYGFVNFLFAPDGFYEAGYSNETLDKTSGKYRLYSEVYPWVSLSGITGRDFSFGPVADVSLDGQINLTNGNAAGLAGIGFTFKAPLKKDFLKVSAYWRTDNVKENSMQITAAFNLHVWQKAGFRIQGFVDLIPQVKNRAEFGGADLGTDFLSQVRFLFDVGRNTIFKNDSFSKLEIGCGIGMHFNKDLKKHKASSFVPQPCIRLSF
ncbi:hypothetical protein [Flammeovirga kamogawensis]|uniref:Transporter n=1 Tax=Flammeovirga kamogawensis TaxID=373891 RepID=A0ABX8H2V1_9BACT|nr:hypothetical protein [Flammeovirga kamogawensis]MBB6463762.1 hypothetical protein [Flammeovirga kamogawensis]QWG09726.1 hypothetical protein KM029_24315 [Flammeovirga kamogawensis]TRX65239.1 hypothetical protein EO216_22205 [Flammeovirga kamogawensis]